MFCYAFALALQNAGHEVFVDTSLYKNKLIRGGVDLCHNGLETEHLFGLKLAEASDADVRRLSTSAEGLLNRIRRKYFTKKTHYIDTVFSYTPEIFQDTQERYLEGFWQTEKYFLPIEKDIRRLFTFRPPLSEQSAALKTEIRSYKDKGEDFSCASIHVRRGDYLATQSLHVCTETYYNNAIVYVQKKYPQTVFYVFSDDLDWCRKNLDFCGAKAIFVGWNTGSDSWQDMALMSLCRVNIIPNSSFSWWAAWLNNNPDKLIIAPSVWNRRELEYKDSYYKYNYSDIVPESWIRLPID